MSNQVATYTSSDQHWLSSSEQDIRDIYLEKLGAHGVSYFEYLRVYDDGRSAVLASNQNVMRYVFENEVPVAAPIQQQYIQNNFHYFILPTGSYEKAIHEVKDYFNLSHFVNLVERHPGYIDLYCFGANANNPGIINFYLNKMDVLENFKLHFKDRAKDLIKVALKNQIVLSDKMMPPYKGLYKNSKFASANYHLTERQIECLHYLMKGMSIKLIAKQLGLSPRTVEHYLEAVKIKMDCNSRFELFEKAMQLRVFHDKT